MLLLYMGMIQVGASASLYFSVYLSVLVYAMLKFLALSVALLDEVFNTKASTSTSSPSSTSFAKVAQDVTRSYPSQSSPSELSPLPPTAMKEERTIEIPLLEDPLITFLTNLMMKDGKKATARKHVSTLLYTLRTRSSALPMAQLREAIRLASPYVRLTQQKKGGKQVAVPIALGERQRVHKAIEWIIDASDKRKNPNAGGSKVFGERVALEIEAVLNGTSEVLKKKEQLHTTATVSRANVNAGSRR